MTATGLLKPLLRGLRTVVFAATDRLAMLGAARRDAGGVAVLMPHGLGDLVLCTPFIQALQAHHADETMTLVCAPDAEPYVRRHLPAARVILVERARMWRDPRYRFRVLRAMARTGPRLVVQPMLNRDHWVDDALMRASGARERVGCAGNDMMITPSQRRRGDVWYTRLLPETGEAHDVGHYAAICGAITGTTLPRLRPRLAPPPRSALVPDTPYVVLAHEASIAEKIWPAARFAAAAEAIAARTGAAVIAVGHGSFPGDGVIDLGGRLALGDLIAVLAHARVVVTNDSAPLHLAAALGVPVVAVTGGGMPGRYLPYPDEPGAPRIRAAQVSPAWSCFGCLWRCTRNARPGSTAPCIEAVAVREVVDLALEAWRDGATPPAAGP